MTAPRLDHGVLNIPGRTSGINAELDRYKATTRAEAHAQAKNAAAETRAQRLQAKALVESWPDAKCIEVAKRAGICHPTFGATPTAKQARTKLNSVAHWTPKRLLGQGGAA